MAIINSSSFAFEFSKPCNHLFRVRDLFSSGERQTVVLEGKFVVAHIQLSFVAGSHQDFLNQVNGYIAQHGLGKMVRDAAQHPQVSVLELQVKLVHMKKNHPDDHIIDIYV